MIEWATGFDPAHVRVTACALRPAGALGERLAREGVPIRFLGHGRFDPRSAWELARLVKRHRIDVLHLQDFGASNFGRMAALATGRPALVHVHACFDQEGGYPAGVRMFDRMLAPWTARVLAVSEPIRDFCIDRMGFRQDQVEVLSNPAPRHGFAAATPEALATLRARYGLAPDALVVGTTSRLYPVKGLHLLLEAFDEVRRQVPRARLLIVGDGPERARLTGLAARLGLGSHVVFTGFQHDVAAHVQLFSLLAIPSTWDEPCALVALEAFSQGVPVVGFAVGGLPECVRDGESGLLVAPCDGRALARALARALDDAQLLARLARGARAAGLHFSLDSHLARLEGLYRELAAASARRGVAALRPLP
jgi:glycosyltransferase involved in cell wall biosynthesis